MEPTDRTIQIGPMTDASIVWIPFECDGRTFEYITL